MWNINKKELTPKVDPEELKALIVRFNEINDALTHNIREFNEATTKASRVLSDLNLALARTREEARKGIKR